jgi:RHS repeat-associated protein
VRFLANTAGTLTDSYQFDAFGMPIATSGTTPNPFLYSGERFDSSLNLYHLRARYYNMLTGRFMTMNPFPGRIADPATLHKYVYASNNPVNRIDPSGRDDIEEYDELLLETVETDEREEHLLHANEFGECYAGFFTGVAAVIGGTAPGGPEVSNSFFECLLEAEQGLVETP